LERDRNPKEETAVTVVGIIILIILILLAIYLFQRVRGGSARY
jgi:flagellar biogenesis protein FliO